MKVLVLSDSHSTLRHMYQMVQNVRPQAIIHLGDHYDDAQALAEKFPDTPLLQVPGNCDRFRVFGVPETICPRLFGVKLYMTHGHVQGVKHTLHRLLSEARAAGAQVALYGHTHVADIHREEDGLWVVNPGTCGSASGGGAVLELCDGAVVACRPVTV